MAYPKNGGRIESGRGHQSFLPQHHIKKNPRSEAELGICDVVLVSYTTIEAAYSEIRQTVRGLAIREEGFEDETERPGDASAAIHDETLARSNLNRANPPVVRPLCQSRAQLPLLAHSFATIVLDEAHKIRNSNTLVTCGVRQMHAEIRVAVTGTPLQDSLEDLGSLLMFLNISPWQDLVLFKRCFMTKQWQSDLPADRKAQYHDNDAILFAIRSGIGIRRVRNQLFDDEPILGTPKWDSYYSGCGLSSKP
ncbi:hypothetical protein LTR78_001201 [Recurvomyces mirabilis]|uniref:SNF2 N-terminal domain-containing protein n=1 Tax=Recurvomyces mirabilis TaxID=574656 RepID=A0AAE1C5E0_9PEZI|nr:hypothetical protein LTR78_001201 [Recurvomyces mirabilis]KAK5161177.1 hypothetical protein LTS14_000973 [Recurvomyces mirabilis]